MFVIPSYLTFLRLVIPLSIFRWPLWGLLASAFMDVSDWHLIHFTNASDDIRYQNWDKMMDLYYLTFALIMTRQWKDAIARKLAVFLFAYRMIGMILFRWTENHIVLFLFPNIFETFFIFYLLFVFLFKKDYLLTSRSVAWIVTIVLVIPKLINEYFLHVLQRQMWEFYNLGKMIGLSGWSESAVNFLWQGIIFFLIPFAVGFFLIRRIQKEKSGLHPLDRSDA